MPSLGLSQCFRNLLRMCQHQTDILPNQFIQLLHGNRASQAFLLASRCPRQVSSIADIVSVATTATAASTGQLACSATDQCAEEIGIGGIVATGKLEVLSQFGLDLIKLLLAHDTWHLGHRYPFLGWGLRMPASIPANRL